MSPYGFRKCAARANAFDFLRPGRHPDTPDQSSTPAGGPGGDKNKNYKVRAGRDSREIHPPRERGNLM